MTTERSPLDNALDQIVGAFSEIRPLLVTGWGPVVAFDAAVQESRQIAARATFAPAPASTPVFVDMVNGEIVLPDAHVGHPYAYQFNVTGTPPLTFSLVGGMFPIALPGQPLIDSATGKVSGVPTVQAIGTWQFNVQAFNVDPITGLPQIDIARCTATVLP